jgi:hypothetical protein
VIDLDDKGSGNAAWGGIKKQDCIKEGDMSCSTPIAWSMSVVQAPISGFRGQGCLASCRGDARGTVNPQGLGLYEI